MTKLYNYNGDAEEIHTYLVCDWKGLESLSNKCSKFIYLCVLRWAYMAVLFIYSWCVKITQSAAMKQVAFFFLYFWEHNQGEERTPSNLVPGSEGSSGEAMPNRYLSLSFPLPRTK